MIVKKVIAILLLFSMTMGAVEVHLEKLSIARIEKAQEEIQSFLSSRKYKAYGMSILALAGLVGAGAIALGTTNNNSNLGGPPGPPLAPAPGVFGMMSLNKERIVTNSATAVVSGVSLGFLHPFISYFQRTVVSYFNTEVTVAWFVSEHTKLTSYFRDLERFCILYENAQKLSLEAKSYYLESLYRTTNLLVLEMERVVAFTSLVIHNSDKTEERLRNQKMINHLVFCTNQLVELISRMPGVGFSSLATRTSSIIKDYSTHVATHINMLSGVVPEATPGLVYKEKVA